MPEVYGEGDFRYEFVEDWAKLPDGVNFQECPGVACDSNDNVFVLTRGKQPIMVFDRDGNYMRSFGEGLFSDNRTHGLYIGHDDSVSGRRRRNPHHPEVQLQRRKGLGARRTQQPGPALERRAVQPPHLRRHQAQQRRHLRLRRLRQLPRSRLLQPARVQVLLGRAGHRRRTVHPPPQHRFRQQRPGLRGRP